MNEYPIINTQLEHILQDRARTRREKVEEAENDPFVSFDEEAFDAEELPAYNRTKTESLID